MRRSSVWWTFWTLCILGYLLAPALAHWQSRDSNYNISVAAGGGGGVALDANGTFGFNGAGSPATYTGLTMGSSLSKAAVTASFCFDNPTPTGVSATLNTVAMTQISTRTAGGGALEGHCEIWGIILGNSPTSGVQSIVITWTGTSEIYICASSFSNVNQTFVTAFTGATAGGNSTSLSLIVTSAAGHYVFGAQELGDTSGTISAVAPSVVLYTDNAHHVGVGGNNVNASGNVTLSATASGITNWLIAATDIAP